MVQMKYEWMVEDGCPLRPEHGLPLLREHDGQRYAVINAHVGQSSRLEKRRKKQLKQRSTQIFSD